MVFMENMTAHIIFAFVNSSVIMHLLCTVYFIYTASKTIAYSTQLPMFQITSQTHPIGAEELDTHHRTIITGNFNHNTSLHITRQPHFLFDPTNTAYCL